jgi:TRAP-type mannitol/chloroaromatic compound transport system permease small subunit
LKQSAFVDGTAGENMMRPLLGLSTAIDQLNEKIGYICNFLVLAACIVSAGNAMIRYAFGYSSNGWLELQWYMFAILVMFGASYTFKRNEHVRVEILYLMLPERGQIWLDLIGTLFFLIPSCLLLSYLSWPFFYQSYAVGEISSNAGGLIRWPIKLVVPIGMVMLAVQGVSEVIKRIAALKGYVTIDAKYERPTQ